VPFVLKEEVLILVHNIVGRSFVVVHRSGIQVYFSADAPHVLIIKVYPVPESLNRSLESLKVYWVESNSALYLLVNVFFFRRSSSDT